MSASIFFSRTLRAASFGLHSLVIFWVDFTVLCGLYWSAFENAQDTSNAIQLLSTLYRHHLVELGHQLKRVHQIVQPNSKSSTYRQLYLRLQLANFREQHSLAVQMCAQIRDFICPAYSIIVCSQIAFTVYMMTLLLSRDNLSKVAQAMLVSVSVTQMGGMIVAALPLIALTKRVHTFGPQLVALQALLTPISSSPSARSYSRSKLKLQTSVEFIHQSSDQQVTFEVIPLGVLTTYSLMQILLLWSCYLMISIQFYRKILV